MDKNIFIRIKEGDIKSFHQFYSNQFNALCAFAYKYLNDISITEDIVQHILSIHYGGNNGKHPMPYRESKAQVLHEFEMSYFRNLLNTTLGNLTKAARYADMDRKNLREKLKQIGIYK